MVSRKSSLSRGDLQDILSHVKACEEVINKHSGELSVMELMFRSTLGALQRTLYEQLRLKDGED
jgi:hypothetical protein